MFIKIFTTCYFNAKQLVALTFFGVLSSLAAQAQNGSNQVPKSSFSAKLMNIEAAANETFRYSTTLKNGSNRTNIYELKAELPLGWSITYRVDGNQLTSLSMEAGKSQDIAVEINATATADPKKYKIPIRGITQNDTLLLNLEAVVKGSYGMTLSTPTGKLSEELTSGSQKQLQLIVKNTGTLPLNDINLSSQLPTNWETTFEPSQIKELAPGKDQNVTATIKVPDKTIAGDYAATYTANNSNSNAQSAFRFIVTTSLLSGWIGILVIIAAISVVYYLIRKYGRR